MFQSCDHPSSGDLVSRLTLLHEISLKRDCKQESGVGFDTEGQKITKNNVQAGTPARYFSRAKLIIKANCKIVMLGTWLDKKAQTTGTSTVEVNVGGTCREVPRSWHTRLRLVQSYPIACMQYVGEIDRLHLAASYSTR
jgi:hypothetical protein